MRTTGLYTSVQTEVICYGKEQGQMGACLSPSSCLELTALFTFTANSCGETSQGSPPWLYCIRLGSVYRGAGPPYFLNAPKWIRTYSMG
jgi:hypothetical protein